MFVAVVPVAHTLRAITGRMTPAGTLLKVTAPFPVSLIVTFPDPPIYSALTGATRSASAGVIAMQLTAQLSGVVEKGAGMTLPFR
jgi:hypothetical protein